MMRREGKNTTDKPALTGILSEFREALEDEIAQIEKNGQASTLLRLGRRIDHEGQDHWYRFNVEYAPSLPADTPCKLIIGTEQYDATVISFEESELIISTKALLPDTIENARLENGSTVLMERLISCIEKNANIENKLGTLMLPSDSDKHEAHRLYKRWQL